MADVIRDFKDLIVWQKAMRFAREVYQLSQLFPKTEQFVLTSQIRRAAISAPSNIAEGHTRQGREFLHYLSIARGSLAEVESQLILAVDLGFLDVVQLKEINELIPEIRKMCIALTRKIREANP